jgi:hypothetical protein
MISALTTNDHLTEKKPEFHHWILGYQFIILQYFESNNPNAIKTQEHIE